MRVTSVDMFSANIEEPISFSLDSVEQDAQYMVRSILGLDAEEIIQKFYGSSYTGKQFYNFNLNPRDIVMRIALNPRVILGESYSDIRDSLYRAISSTRTGGVKLHFNSGATVVSSIFGFISKFETAYFNQLPEVQLTIRCNDPMFRAINPVIFGPDDLAVNPVIIPDSLSTAPHGFVMEVVFNETAYTFTIQDKEVDPEWRFYLVPYEDLFLAGDVLHISSEFSDKSVYIIRAGNTIPIANTIQYNSNWPIVFPFPSENKFYIAEFDSLTWVSLEYYASYWGV